MSFKLNGLDNSEIDAKTLNAIAYCLSILSDGNLKTIKSVWARKYAMEVSICAELNLISLKSEYHPMSRDSKLKVVKENDKLDFSMGAWNITPKGKLILEEIKEKYLKSLKFNITLVKKVHNKEIDPDAKDEDYYNPWGW